jgi:M6 family metalloprotease-like protein
MIRKIRIILVLSACLFSNIYASNAYRGSINYTQPDGTILTNLSIAGDEFFRFYYNTKGEKWVADSLGFLHKATDASMAKMRQNAVQNREFFNQEIIQLKSRQAVKRQKAAQPRYAVILVEFSDLKFSIPAATYQRFFNAMDYTENGATGSVSNYFSDVSRGQLNPIFDVYASITLSKSMAYYGSNTSTSYDTGTREMVVEACQQLDATTDFSLYDQNSDGEIDAIYFVYAGYSESEGASANAIWPKSWFLETPITLDGKSFSKFTCTSELSGNTGATISGIGTFCHEFSHKLGLVDLYDTDYGDNGLAYNFGDWSIMGSGNYLNGGKTPPYYTAIDLVLSGFAEPTTLNNPSDITVNPINEHTFYRINTANEGEYYLLENRQKNKWDAFIPAHGLLITHIDKSSGQTQKWENNRVNSVAAHPCVDVVEADLNPSENSQSGDTYPGTTQKTTFTNTTNPAILSWLGKKSTTEITNIQESNGIITMKVNGGAAWHSPLLCLPATNVSSSGFTANITAVPEAENYLLSVYTKANSDIPADSVQTNFNTLPKTLQQGWTFSDSELGEDTENFGKASPAFVMYLNRQTLTSPCTNEALSKLKFWYKANNLPAAGASLQLSASTDYGTWTEIYNLNINSSKDSVFVLAIDTALHYNALKFTWKSNSAQLLLDDISLYSGKIAARNYLIESQNIDNSENYVISNLTITNQPVYYSYKAQKGAAVSAASNEQKVEMTNGNISVSDAGISVLTKRNSVQVICNRMLPYTLFSITGQVLAKGQLTNPETNIALHSGLQLLLVGSRIFKINHQFN